MSKWQSTKNAAIWSPAKDEEGKDRKCTDNSYLEGYYMGTEYEMGERKNSQLHAFEVHELEGNKNEIPVLMKLWGTTVLDDLISKLQKGDYIRVKWEGLTQPKKSGAKPYHDWDVLTDGVTPNKYAGNPTAAQNPAVIPAAGSTETKSATPTQNPAQSFTPVIDESDDLPF